MLDRIRIVLINTSHPGNIGSVARAMKTMGLKELYLVCPKNFPHPKAQEMASGAKDILDNARVFSNLNDALADCTFLLGTSARSRTIPWPIMTPRDAAHTIKHESCSEKVAILFGREQSGLTNEELERCHYHIQIPADQDYSSLNLASAVQILAYELRLASLDLSVLDLDTKSDELANNKWDYRFASADEMEKFFIHLQESLIEAQFLKLSAPRKLMTRLRRLFLRARPDVMEINILRGMLSAFQEKLK